MADVNYVNPQAMYPLQTGGSGTALGAGTTPGSFLSGWMLPDRMQDYQNVLGQSLLSTKIANQKAQAELQDYLSNKMPLSAAQSKAGIGAAETQSVLEPGLRQLALGEQTGAKERQPSEQELKLKQAINSLPVFERQAHLATLVHGAGLLKMYTDKNGNLPEGVDPALISQELHKQGVDIPPGHIKSLAKMDPEYFKHLLEMQKIEEQSRAHIAGYEVLGKSRVEAAQIRADTSKMLKEATTNPTKLETEYHLANSIAPEERTPYQQQLVDHYLDIINLKNQGKANATAEAQSSVPAKTIEKIQNLKKNPKPAEVKPDTTQEEYTRLKKGEPVWRGGKMIPKQ